MSPIKQKDLSDAEKTESGATRGSTGEVVDALVNNILIRRRKEKERELGLKERVAEILRKHREKHSESEEGGGRVR